MESYSTDLTPLWDLSQASSFSQMTDDDFLALLQKPNYTTAPFNAEFSIPTGVDPQSISQYPLPSITPPSTDSSPSPPHQDNRSPVEDNELKRKASTEDFDDDGPSSKNQHTANGKKTGNARRKSTGAVANAPAGPEENRLLKRKEQNRAAQRAFRERKEKHVKDLEDKVAELEAKNDQANSENENLRDLLTRLQNENVLLKGRAKNAEFTFSVPRSSGGSADAGSSSSLFTTPALTAMSTPSPSALSPTPGSSNPLDWSSLTSFDPAVLNLLDDTPQQTATDAAMSMDFGFGSPKPDSASKGLNGYTTIASNPMFTSFTSAFDHPAHRSQSSGSSSVAGPSNSSSPSMSANPGANAFNFDINSLSAWSTPNPDGQFDDLFGGIMGSSMDFEQFNVLMNSPPGSSVSPVAHHATLLNRSPAASISSSTSSKSPDPLFTTIRETGSDTDLDMETMGECPKTREGLRSEVTTLGSSPFAPPVVAVVRKPGPGAASTITCQGSSFPKTERSEKNLEILEAWRTVTSNPEFRDTDIADLCSEFSAKARCDGTKVVLEPANVRNIIEGLAVKHGRQ